MNAVAKAENWKILAWIVGGIVALALGWFLSGRLFPDNKPGPTKSELSADSLRITKPAEQALLDSIDARIASRGLISSRAESGANRAKQRADSLAIARVWEGAYIARTEQADSLLSVVVELKADTTDLRTQLGVVTRRLEKTEAVVVGLRWDLEQARKCKILGFINCPSRIQTAALTVVAVVGIDRYRNR